MTIRIFVLPTQYDIIDFRLGRRPANLSVRDFNLEAEARAYRQGIDAAGDEYDRIENLEVVGSTVIYTRSSNDPDADLVAKKVERSFSTRAEVDAYCKGIDDAEGLAAPLLIDETDDRFEQLQAWSIGSCT